MKIEMLGHSSQGWIRTRAISPYFIVSTLDTQKQKKIRKKKNFFVRSIQEQHKEEHKTASS
jgi:hypothetical protein